MNQLSRANLGHAATLSWQELIELGYIVAGSPETVRQRMEELIKALRVGNIICLFQMGNMPTEKTCHSSELFARKVMPHLKRIWKDYDGDDASGCSRCGLGAATRSPQISGGTPRMEATVPTRRCSSSMA